MSYGYKRESNFTGKSLAETIIEDFINSDDSYDIKTFLNDHNIDWKQFKKMAADFEKEDSELYKRYSQKFKINSTKAFEKAKKSFEEIYDKIVLEAFGCSSFDLFKFWSIVPFRGVHGHAEFEMCIAGLPSDLSHIDYASNSSVFVRRVKSFLEVVLPTKYEVIYEYLVRHRIVNNTSLSSGTEENLRAEVINLRSYTIWESSPSGVKVARPVSISEKDVENIISYMRTHHFPFMLVPFNLVLERFLKGELVLNNACGLNPTK